jgi:hypothetical protein
MRNHYRLLGSVVLVIFASTAHGGMAIYKFSDLTDKVSLNVTAPYPGQEIEYETTSDGVESATFTANVTGFNIPDQSLIAFVREPGTGDGFFPKPAQVSDLIRYDKFTETDEMGNPVETLTIVFESDGENGGIVDPLDFLANGALIEDGTMQAITTFHSTLPQFFPIENPPPTDEYFIQSDAVETPEPSSLALLGFGGGCLMGYARRWKRESTIAKEN